ncbi:DoxX family protein [Micromonospora sp. NPDC050200]|uniref:DoxX family protein n=1 Tax=Micromonospora sp. NPDC050200 TaxID=3155664 RepID=UPI003400A677
MNVFLWILQALLAVAFALAGLMKASQPKEKLARSMPWTDDFSAGTVKFVGAVEILGALGLILPAATGIVTWLTPLASTGLAVTMVLAGITHARRNEPGAIAFNAVLLILAAVIGWGRFGPYAF